MNILLAAAEPTTIAENGSWAAFWAYITLALGVSFVCSVLEAVLLTTRRAHIEVAIQQGSRGARLMGRLKHDLDQAISAILTLNTVAHTLGAAGAGAQAAALLSSDLLGLVSGLLTLAILFLSEIVPKTIGAIYWKPLLSPSAYVIRFLIVVLYPIVWLSQAVTRALKPKNAGPTVTRAEIEILARISQREGDLDERELQLIRNLFQLGNVRVVDILTPRTVVFALPRSLTVGEVRDLHPNIYYSRIPIFTESIDDANAFVLRHDILAVDPSEQPQVTLDTLARPLHSAAPDLRISRALDRFIAEQQHIFLVVDEFGGTEGIVTLEDAIETLLGTEIVDESDYTANLQALAQRRQRDRLARIATEKEKRKKEERQQEESAERGEAG